MKLASVKDLQRYEAPQKVKGNKKVAFHFRTPRVLDSAKLRRLVVAMGGVICTDVSVNARLFQGIREICTQSGEVDLIQHFHDKVTEFKAVAEEFRAYVLAADPESGEIEDPQYKALRNRLAELEPEFLHVTDTVRDGWPPYAQALADREMMHELLPMAALRLLLVKTQNLPGGEIVNKEESPLPEIILERIPRDMIAGAGDFALQLFGPGSDDEKKS